MGWGTGNLGGGGSGGADNSMILVTAPEGTVSATASYNGKTKIGKFKDGMWRIDGLDFGPEVVWEVEISNGSESAKLLQPINQLTIIYLSMGYQLKPDSIIWPTSAQSGVDYEIVNPESTDWIARIYTSMDIEFSQNGFIDATAVGAGGGGSSRGSSKDRWGGGGGGGYTKNGNKIPVVAGKKYSILIGSGSMEDGGESSGFNLTAPGGKKSIIINGDEAKGGNGGSGGAGYRGNPGSDGHDASGTNPGIGQHMTTREFGEPEGKLYSTGGSFSTKPRPEFASPGDGGHGGGNKDSSTPGQNGAFAFRQHKEGLNV